jgi:hypothetical protein
VFVPPSFDETFNQECEMSLTSRRSSRRAAAAAAALAVVPILAAGIRLGAQTPTGQSFTSLASGYSQELFATVDVGAFPSPNQDIAKVLGGVAYAPDGDVWVADCVFQATTLHRFDTATFAPPVHGTGSRRAEILTVDTTQPDGTGPGCGLTNHPDGSLYSNSIRGVYKLNADTGVVEAGPLGQPGNALGVAVDPTTQHLVYAGADCHTALVPGSPACTLWDLDPATGLTTPYAMFPHDDVPFVDGIYFSPTGSHLFVTNRIDQELETLAGTVELNHLTVVGRPTGPVTSPSADQVIRHLPMLSEPDGVAFHGIEHFVVTNDEASGTMTRFDFPGGDYSLPPSTFTEVQPVDGAGDPVGSPIRVYGTFFASGGHRGDLTQVGPDGCIYATQGRNFNATDFGTRYDDGAETTEDSIVRICSTTGGGFDPPPGVERDSQPGSIAGSVYLDINGNHAIDGADQFLPGVTVTLGGALADTRTSNGGPVPAYQFDALNAGDYTVNVPATFGGYALSGSTPTGATATITEAGENHTGIDFLYEPGRISGSVYLDNDDDGAISGADTFLSGVPLALSGPSSDTANSGGGPAPTFTFSRLTAGSYSVNAPITFAGYHLAAATPAPQSRVLAAGGDVTDVHFLYVRARLSGYAYLDANANGARDAGEAPLAGVSISVPGLGATTTQADGGYAFSGLVANAYHVGASTPASGFVLSTPSPLSVDVPAGGTVTDVNFGYRPGGLSGFAYLDVNKNGVKDSAEPGLANVVITLAGGATAVTNASGAYLFSDLVAGSYTVAAPATAFGYALWTPNPLNVTLTPGQISPNNNFGYKDVTKPVCAVYGSANPPYMTFQDSGSGIVRLNITKNLNTNFLVTITPGPSAFAPATVVNPSAMPTGTVAFFGTPTTAQVRTYAQRINTSLSAQLIVVATDAFGNNVSCDPVETTVTKLRHDRGIQTFTDIPYEEHFITIENGDPGLRGLDIDVNGQTFLVRGLTDNEVKRVNVRRAMLRGNSNTITLIPRGRRGESADVTIAARE